jgi:hypothetical protein
MRLRGEQLNVPVVKWVNRKRSKNVKRVEIDKNIIVFFKKYGMRKINNKSHNHKYTKKLFCTIVAMFRDEKN